MCTYAAKNRESGNDSGSFYMDYQVKDLSIKRWGRVSVYAVDNDEFNSAEHVMILFQDITEQKEKEIEYQQTLREAYEIAERANQAKTTFLNNMSHDIRTPMNAIIGFTSLAATHLEDPERLKGYLSKIMVSSNHFLSLINDVLDMSRIESGKVKIEENECSISERIIDCKISSDLQYKMFYTKNPAWKNAGFLYLLFASVNSRKSSLNIPIMCTANRNYFTI